MDHKKEFLKYFAKAWKGIQAATNLKADKADYDYLLAVVDDCEAEKKRCNAGELDVVDLIMIVTNEYIVKCLKNPPTARNVDFKAVLAEEWSFAKEKWGDKADKLAYDRLLMAIEGSGKHYGRVDWELIARLAVLQCMRGTDDD